MTIKTEDLVAILGHVPPVDRPLPLSVVALFLTMLSALITILWLGVRPELSDFQAPLSFWIKTLVLAGVFLISLRALRGASIPVALPVTHQLTIWFSLGITFLLVHEWITTDHREIVHLFLLPNFASCLQHVSLYGAVSMVCLTLVIRHYAPAHAECCAGLIGLVAAASGAIGYSIHCPIDSPTFIVISYGIPMLGLWFIGRLVLPRLLRW